MKSSLRTLITLAAVGLAVLCVRGTQSAHATPGKGGTKFDLSTKTYPNQCATVQETRTMVGTLGTIWPDAGGGITVPTAPLALRNKLFVCNSQESYVLTDAGAPGYVKCRVDGAGVAIGATTPGMVLTSPGLETLGATSAPGQSCTPELDVWNADGGGSSGITCVAQYALTDGGPSIAVDVVECAY